MIVPTGKSNVFLHNGKTNTLKYAQTAAFCAFGMGKREGWGIGNCKIFSSKKGVAKMAGMEILAAKCGVWGCRLWELLPGKCRFRRPNHGFVGRKPWVSTP